MERMRALVAEFVGTFFLVLMGCGAIIVNIQTNKTAVTHVGVSLVFGLVVMAIVYAFGHVSGAHVNPAVTAGFLLMRKITVGMAAMYIATQIVAAVAACGVLRYLFGLENSGYLGSTIPSGTWQQSFILEFFLTMFLMATVLWAAVHPKATASLGGVAIGGVVALEALFAGPICGASMNPARSIGPAIVSGKTDVVWVYIVSTTLGAIAATILYLCLYPEKSPKPEK